MRNPLKCALGYFLLAASIKDQSAFLIDRKDELSSERVFNQLDYTYRKSYTPAKQGQQKFIYPDGFECHALNKKNADKKHNRWKKEGSNGK